jgi:hypothetical protein
MMTKRNRGKQVISFDERLQRAAHEARASAQELPEGSQRHAAEEGESSRNSRPP